MSGSSDDPETAISSAGARRWQRDRLVFPRLSAIAETGWTAAAARNYHRFATIAGLMPSLYGHAEEALP